MSNYKVPYRYDDECELNDAVYDTIWDSFSVGDLDIDQAEMDFSLPQEFIDEWKRLKGYEI